MRTLKSAIKTFSTARPALWIGLPLSLTIGLAFYLATAASIDTDSRSRFSGHAHNASKTISSRIKSYTDVLRGTVSLFQISEPLTRRQFHGYVKGLGLKTHFPAIENINFAAHVPDAERDAFEKRIRSERSASGESLSQFVIKPTGRRAEYTVVTFVEPESVWGSTLGVDLSTIPLVNEYLGSLRDSGELYTSGTPIAFISGPNRTGLGMRLAVYRPHAPTETLSQRRAAYIGAVGIAFSVDKLVKGVIDELPIKNVRMTLVDRADRNSAPARILFDSGLTGKSSTLALLMERDRFETTIPIDFNGRIWDATYSVDAREMFTGFEEFAPWLALLAGMISTMLLYALFHTLTSSRRRAIKMAKGMTRELRDSQSKLQLSHQNLRRLAAHADQIKEGERKRIAREIHDDLGQNLLALRIEADILSARTRERHPRLHARASATLQQIDVTIKSVRQIINDLRPNVLDLGLSAAVEWQIAEFTRRSGIPCELKDEPKEVVLNDHAATAFFRILQESLSNIVRHANATHVRVELKLNGARLSMTVSDNGIGFQGNAQHKVGSFGLVGIEERISILGGSFSINSVAGEGTTVCVTIPLLADAGASAAQSVASTLSARAVLA